MTGIPKIKLMRSAKSSKQGLRGLCELVTAAGKTAVAVEVGAYMGEATVILAEYMQSVYAVDQWRTGYDPKDRASRDNGIPVRKAFIDRTHDVQHIYSLHMTGDMASALFTDGTLDLVYIDADHRYPAVKRDIELWRPKVVPGGFITGHDYRSGVKQAVDEAFPGVHVECFCDSSWAVQL